MHFLNHSSHFLAFHGGRGGSAGVVVALVVIVLLAIAFAPGARASEARNHADHKND